ncbi:MAG: nucleotidyl transferase AbiEii/AbiGii toxin family protein, partial [Minisyncoccia bacterium]
MKTILSESQQKVLNLLAQEPSVTGPFYLSGGTALAEYYLHHRLSEDLDFFSVGEFDPSVISVVLKKIQAAAKVTNVRYQQSFNRNLFFLETVGETIKTEFTYYPFERIGSGQKVGNLEIDSLEDIAVNKLFTIFQKPRSRDFIDLYCIMQKESWTIAELTKKAQIKFDTYIDPLQLGTQFLKAKELTDFPRMLIPLEPA